MKYFIYCRKSTDSEDRQVMSLDSQASEASKLVQATSGIEVQVEYRESRSAKKPGRPIFNEMLERIERGEAEGIVAWHPDRLARNALDGARIIDLLDRGKLKSLKFSTFAFENSSQGKLMLFTLFAFSKYYVDSLSENIKRSNRTKAELGWRPTRPPIGYRHDPVTKTIVQDPERFVLVRQMFQMMLTGVHTPRSIYNIARREWGLRTVRHKSLGGALVHLSSVNVILRNPFYAGLFEWEGRVRCGRHEPMLTIAEFDKVQAIIRRPDQRRPKKKAFPYTGIIRCGACGLTITAEDKRNKYGSQYTYYHCTRSRYEAPCHERYIRKEQLENQILAFLESLTVAGASTCWLEEVLTHDQTTRAQESNSERAALEAHLRALDREISNLTDLRLRDILSDEEFTTKRYNLMRTRLDVAQRTERSNEVRDWIEPLRTLIAFSNRAVEYFSHGDEDQKRLLLSVVSSNSTLKDRILSIEARKPFVRWGSVPAESEMRRFTLGVRTSVKTNDEGFMKILADIREIVVRDKDRRRAA